jgi:hypothetical protein
MTMKQLHEYDTPETESEYAIGWLNDEEARDFARSLEQRLAACRDALAKFEGCFDCYECSGTAEQTLTLTAPK